MFLLALQLAALTPTVTESDKSLLVIVLDDVGPEHLEFTPQGQDAGNPVSTPVLSALASTGIRYTNFQTMPNCSPTRAALLTGRYPHRTGIGQAIKPGETAELPATEATIADRLAARGYATMLAGKWHLGEVDPEQVCAMGFQSWTGAQENLSGAANYWYWERYDDTAEAGAAWSLETAYAPSVTTDAALAWIQAQSGPWFAMVSYNLAHAPYHEPPGFAGMCASPLEKYRAMIECLDGEVGRLLAGVSLEEVTVLVLSDNGSPGPMAMLPNTAEHSKGTAYRGGIETTMICAGYAVQRAINTGKNTAGQVLTGHANAVDICATAMRLMPPIMPDPGGWPLTDSLPLYTATGKWIDTAREWTFSERFEPNGVAPGGPYTELSRAVEEHGYKAVWNELGEVELFDVVSDPWETVDTLLDGISPEEQATLDGLTARLAEIGIP